MTICYLCEHDLDRHKIERDGNYQRVVCYYEQGQYTESSFCRCNAGFSSLIVEITVRKDSN